MNHYKCLADLEKRLSDAAGEVVSGALNYDGYGPYHALVDDLVEVHKLDEAYVPLLADMIRERVPMMDVEVINNEIMVQRDQLPGPSPLPFQPDRMEHLLDKALDWIGEHERGSDLYDTLRNMIGMEDDEILAAGFECLEKYFDGPDTDENPVISM